MVKHLFHKISPEVAINWDAKITIRFIGISCFTTSTTCCYYTLTILLNSFHRKAEWINL